MRLSMNCKITVTPDFLRELKRLSKRYRSLKTDVKDLGNELAKNPLLGTDLGHRLRKVRMSITSKGKGKLAQVEAEIKLITIYDKSERENISDAELLDILRRNGIE